MASLGELVVNLGVKADTFKVRNFGNAIDEIPASAAAAVFSMAGLSLGFEEMTNRVLQMTSGLRLFTAETGLNNRALQQWQQVLKQGGFNPESATGAIQSLSNIIGKLNFGGGLSTNVAKAMSFLGLSAGDLGSSPYEMLNNIQAASKGKNTNTLKQALEALGINGEMMVAFQTPQSERERINPTMTNGQIDQMSDFQKELANFNNVVMRQFVDALVKVEPSMANLAKALGAFVQVGGDFAGFLGKSFNNFSKNVIRDEPKPVSSPWLHNFLQSIKDYSAANDVTINNNIYSNATDAEAVGRYAAEEIIRSHMRKASGEINKAGK